MGEKNKGYVRAGPGLGLIRSLRTQDNGPIEGQQVQVLRTKIQEFRDQFQTQFTGPFVERRFNRLGRLLNVLSGGNLQQRPKQNNQAVTVKCPRCSREMPKEYKHCPHCGFDIEEHLRQAERELQERELQGLKRQYRPGVNW